MQSPHNNIKILLLASGGSSTSMLYHAVNEAFPISHIIIEDRVKTSLFLKQRYKKVGLLRIIDQLLFILIINKLLALLSGKRSKFLLMQKNLCNLPIDETKIVRVPSANAAETIELIKKILPDIILVNGTRILSKKLLNSTTATIVNLHAGITPEYRGVHGAYWAYANNEPGMAGVTLHYVDKGVDTGNIISQSIIQREPVDNFTTYPLLQLYEGIVLLKNFLKDYSEGREINPIVLTKHRFSKQWYHPGFFEYLYYRLFHGSK